MGDQPICDNRISDPRIERSLTLHDAGLLADLIHAVERNAKMSYYPLGTGSADNPLEVSLRCFAHDGGGLWFDTDGDVRDAYIWCSGITEHWFKVRDLMAALDNIDGKHGLDRPIARLSWTS